MLYGTLPVIRPISVPENARKVFASHVPERSNLQQHGCNGLIIAVETITTS